MRTTWIILGVMLLAGLGMYYIFNYKSPPGEYDTIRIKNTDGIVAQKIKIYQAGNPTELYFLDSIWMTPDSTPLNKVLDGSNLQFINRRYASQAIILTYDNRLFYDLVFDKEDTNKTYEISFRVQSLNDTMFVKGTIDKQEGNLVRFQGPMLNMYKQFIISYNNRMPQPVTDAASSDTNTIEKPLPPSKTITVLQN